MRKNVHFGSEALDRARRDAGLTNREIWEELGISETSWMRWKRTGEVPLEKLDAVVTLLRLERPNGLSDDIPQRSWGISAMNETIQRLDRRVRRIEAQLARLGVEDGSPPD